MSDGGTADEPVSPAPSGGARGVRTSIVLPAYDEAGNLRPLTEELRTTLDAEPCRPYAPFEVVFVDDGSTDGSRETLEALAAEYDDVRAVLLRRNFGQSAALAAGVDHAAGEVVVTMDADRQNDPADVPRLLSELERGYDCVKGWRRDREDPPGKTLPSAVQTRLAWLTGPRIHDYVCGIAAYRAAAIRDVPLYGGTHRYVPAMLHARGYRVTELAVNHRPRGAGGTKYGVSRLLPGFVDLCFHAYYNRFGDRPLHALGGGALAAVAAGTLVAAAVVLASVAGAVTAVPDWGLLAAVVLGATAAAATALAAVGVAVETATRHRYRDERPYRVDRVADGVTPDAPTDREPSAVPRAAGAEPGGEEG